MHQNRRKNKQIKISKRTLKSSPRKKTLKTAQSQETRKFFVNKARMGSNEDMSLPDAITRLYILNVEAAQNHVDLENQIKTTSLLNKNFPYKFKQKNYRENPSRQSENSLQKIVHMNSYVNHGYQLKRF